MKVGVTIIVDENGNIIEEGRVVIEDGATTAVRKGNRYEYGWDER